MNSTEEKNELLLRSTFDGNARLARRALSSGANANCSQANTGLTPLHIAAGSDHLALSMILIDEFGAAFGPDAFGRWPSLVAAECGASDEMCSFIAEREAVYLLKHNT